MKTTRREPIGMTVKILYHLVNVIDGKFFLNCIFTEHRLVRLHIFSTDVQPNDDVSHEAF
jgi:hypothetical protein